MTTRTPRLLFLTSGLALASLAAGIFAACEWTEIADRAEAAAPVSATLPVQQAAYSEPVPEEDLFAPRLSEPEDPALEPLPNGQEAFRRATNPNGALLQNLRLYQTRNALSEEAAPALNPEDQTASIPPRISVAPLPPARPAEFAALFPPDFIAPSPPPRPAEFGPPEATAALTRGPATPEQARPETAAPTLSLASLLPSDQGKPLASPEDGNFRIGDAAFVRIFKQEGELELWLKRNGRYALYRTYPICKWSGHLGPKLRTADYQSPEGFYSVSAKQLNPRSAYHRAFNIGFPNAYDRQLGRTGGALMVHGACKSVGCFAMTDKVIEEIYGYVEAALRGGQREVPVHIFPFRMSDEALAKATTGDWTNFWSVPPHHQQWASFWQNLKEGYDLFERTGEPPTAYVCGSRYGFGQAGQSCTRIAGW